MKKERRAESHSRREALRWIVGLSVAGLGGALVHETLRERTFLEKVANWKWSDFWDERRRTQAVEILAAEYVKVSGTGLVGVGDLQKALEGNFTTNRGSFVNQVRQVEPNYMPGAESWGYAHFGSRKIFVDLGTLENVSRQAMNQAGMSGQSDRAGLAMLDGLWHEWGHLDVKERFTSRLIGHPNFGFVVARSGRFEKYESFRGGRVFTDTYNGFLRWDEVLVETITVRRMLEILGLKETFGVGDYFPNGVDIFFPFSQKIALPRLVELYSGSDIEGQMMEIGRLARGSEEQLIRGWKLMIALNEGNGQMARQLVGASLVG